MNTLIATIDKKYLSCFDSSHHNYYTSKDFIAIVASIVYLDGYYIQMELLTPISFNFNVTKPINFEPN